MMMLMNGDYFGMGNRRSCFTENYLVFSLNERMPQLTEIYLDKEDDVLDYCKRVIFNPVGLPSRGVGTNDEEEEEESDEQESPLNEGNEGDKEECSNSDDDEEEDEDDGDDTRTHSKRHMFQHRSSSKRYTIQVDNNYQAKGAGITIKKYQRKTSE